MKLDGFRLHFVTFGKPQEHRTKQGSPINDRVVFVMLFPLETSYGEIRMDVHKRFGTAYCTDYTDVEWVEVHDNVMPHVHGFVSDENNLTTHNIMEHLRDLRIRKEMNEL